MARGGGSLERGALNATPRSLKVALLEREKGVEKPSWLQTKAVPICTCLVVVASVSERLCFKAMLDNMNSAGGHYRCALAFSFYGAKKKSWADGCN